MTLRIVLRLTFLAGNLLLLSRMTESASGNNHNAVAAMSDSPLLGDSAMSGPSIMGESALVDKETGRIFWEGGYTTLSASLGPFLDGIGVKHARATVMSFIFVFAILSSIVAWTRRYLDETINPDSCCPWPVSALLVLLNWPNVNVKFLITVIVLYLIESYTCSTRRYLANALTSPTEVEDYMERLRREPPVVTWKVRCFHYERRKWLSALSYLWALRRFLKIAPDDDAPSSGMAPPAPWMVARKVVTHQAVGNYTYSSCDDKTIAGVWSRAEATADANPAPFSKIILSKLLILANKKAREDYFKQQSDFVSRQGQMDEYAEYSTSIQVDGFRRRMLAVRPVQGVPSTKLFRLHLYWIFTLLGLTVPYRIWFARHCDELRVTVAKETSVGRSSNSKRSWFSRSDPEQVANEEFKRQMRELALYAKTKLPPMNETKSSEAVVAGLIEGKTNASSVTTQQEEASTTETVVSDEVLAEGLNATKVKTDTVEKEKDAGAILPISPPTDQEESVKDAEKDDSTTSKTSSNGNGQ